MDKADNSFIEEWRPFVASIAHKVRREYDLRGQLDELMAAGFIGLLEARSRYDETRGVQLNTFAYYRVRGAMLDQVRTMGFLSPRAHARRKAAEAANDALADSAAGRAAAPPGTPVVEQSLGQIDDILGKLTASYVLASLGQGEEPQPTAEDALMSTADAVAVREAVEVLPEREAALVRGFYFEGRRFDEVAAELGISKSWASRLHTKALALLRERLEGG